jgi:hypothetical protein
MRHAIRSVMLKARASSENARIKMRIPYRLRLLKWRLFRRSSGEKFLRDVYASRYGKDIDVTNPRTFSEHLFTRMIMVNRHGNARFTELADKYLVREYVRERVGEKYLVDLLWHGVDPRKAPFDSLPQTCVIKTNHGSGQTIIFNETTNREDVIEKLSIWMKQNFYWCAREFQYYKIPRKILIEQLLDDGEPCGPLDYRFWCFNGKPEVIQVDNNKYRINPFYDRDWNKLDLSYRDKFADCDIKKPAHLNEMIDVASALSAGFDFVRVDLYNIRGKIYFGELTFTPAAGNFVLTPHSWDAYLGQKWSQQSNLTARKPDAAIAEC